MAQIIETMGNWDFYPVRERCAARQALPAIAVDIADENFSPEQVWAIDRVNVVDADRALRPVDFPYAAVQNPRRRN